MKKAFLTTILSSLIIAISYGDTWDVVNEKTWLGTESSFAGDSYVFYETANGLKKAIWQVHGSGVCVVLSFIYDVELNGNAIYLVNGRNLKPDPQKKRDNTPSKQTIYVKNDSILVSKDGYEYKRQDGFLLFDWESLCDTISLQKLKTVSIQKGERYSRDAFFDIPSTEDCGIDDNPLLTETEAMFLNQYLIEQTQSLDFDFTNKRILFITGPGGGTLGTKIDYFNNIKEWKNVTTQSLL